MHSKEHPAPGQADSRSKANAHWRVRGNCLHPGKEEACPFLGCTHLQNKSNSTLRTISRDPPSTQTYHPFMKSTFKATGSHDPTAAVQSSRQRHPAEPQVSEEMLTVAGLLGSARHFCLRSLTCHLELMTTPCSAKYPFFMVVSPTDFQSWNIPLFYCNYCATQKCAKPTPKQTKALRVYKAFEESPLS